MKIEPTKASDGRMCFHLPDGTAVLMVSKDEAMKFFDLVERKPAGFGMASTVLFTELVQAVKADEAGEGCDLAAGVAGPAVSEWVRDLARNFLDLARAAPAVRVPAASLRVVGKPVALGADYGVSVHNVNPVDVYESFAQVLYPNLQPDPLAFGQARAALDVEADIVMVDDELTDEIVDSTAGRVWMGYQARINQYESAYGRTHMHIPARIDCMRRALESQQT